MYILGLNYIGHDASAAILEDGRVIASAMEERFSRIKHDRNFPERAIRFCLAYARIHIKDVDVITFYMDPQETFEQRVIHHLGRYYPKSTPLFDGNLERCLKIKNVEKEIREKLGYLKEIYFCNHHMAHLASAFFQSNFRDCVSITIDGLGEIASTVIADVDENHSIKVLKRVIFPHSTGCLYNSVTHYLGFNAVTDAGKLMGLSAYGNPETYIEKFRDIVSLKDDGTYELDLDYFDYPFQRDTWISQKFIETFGPKRTPDEPIHQRHMDVAAAAQRSLEETLFHIAEEAKKMTQKDYLCLSGGVALNSVANGKLAQKQLFKDIFIPPAAGDDGTSIGSALFYNHCVAKNKKRFSMMSPYLGSEYSDAEVERAIQKFGLKYHKSPDVCQETAARLAENNIVGWYQGRMEVGPRALGNRSILANAGFEGVKEILNARVKFREPFRPFAPSILREHVKDWFVFDHESPHMLMVFNVKNEKQKIIPGVTHADGSGRLQTITEEMNPLFYQLIEEFYKLTSIPIVVNTSFNIKGEPIVESPVDAIRCFLGNGIDYLVMGNFIIGKEN